MARARLLAFLSVFGEDSAYRNRAVYTACAATCVANSVSRETFEACFLDNLTRMARDPVVSVRIGVARVIAAACEIGMSAYAITDDASTDILITEHLYADISYREPLIEVLSSLANSPDRDVRVPVLPFYVASPRPSPPPSSPPVALACWDRSGSRMQMQLHGDSEDNFEEDNSMEMELCGDERDVEMVEVPSSIASIGGEEWTEIERDFVEVELSRDQ